MHAAGRRVLGVFIDPVMSCNLRCKMCYFSDPAKRATMHGVISDERLDAVERALFHRALKLQIGCGAEPTLYPKLAQLIERGRRAGIPYISLTSNGQLLAAGRVNLAALVAAGLNELTLSMHGTTREVYEELMPGASYDNLLELIRQVRDIKKRYPEFKLRVNYTVNSRNVDDLGIERFGALWRETAPDILQLRPVQQLGETEWNDFDLTPLKQKYDRTIGAVIRECQSRGITCIAPTLGQIDAVDNEQDGTSSVIENLTYCYVSPDSVYREDFDVDTDTYESYHRRHHTTRSLIRAALGGSRSRNRNISKKLNYNIE